MNAWEFCGMTEAEYTEKIFAKKPHPKKCCYPKCKLDHAENKTFCESHFKELSTLIYAEASVHKEEIKEGKTE